MEEYFDDIDECSVLKKIISDQYYRITRKYYISLFALFFFGFVCPFIKLIYHAIKVSEVENSGDTDEKTRLNVCLFT